MLPLAVWLTTPNQPRAVGRQAARRLHLDVSLPCVASDVHVAVSVCLGPGRVANTGSQRAVAVEIVVRELLDDTVGPAKKPCRRPRVKAECLQYDDEWASRSGRPRTACDWSREIVDSVGRLTPIAGFISRPQSSRTSPVIRLIRASRSCSGFARIASQPGCCPAAANANNEATTTIGVGFMFVNSVRLTCRSPAARASHNTPSARGARERGPLPSGAAAC